MSTTYVTPAAGWSVYALQARTDESGGAVDDVTAEDMRTLASLFGPGVRAADDYRVAERGAGANMSVDVGSGDAETDVAVLAGTASGQGSYVVRLGDATVNVPVNAADLSQARVDEIYLAVQDDPYDSSGRVVPRLAYRDGTPGAGVGPGPDGAWTAYLLLAQINVGAGVGSISDSDVTDARAFIDMPGAYGGLAPVGFVGAFGGASAPDGWLLCDGSAVSRTTYARLFEVIGIAYGAGNGSSTFNVPDLRQRFPLGKAASGTGAALGGTGGEIDHDHTVDVPSTTSSSDSHNHTVDPPNTATTSAGSGLPYTEGSGPYPASGGHTHNVNIAAFNSGSDSHSHTVNPAAFDSGDNNPPYLVLNFIIRAA